MGVAKDHMTTCDHAGMISAGLLQRTLPLRSFQPTIKQTLFQRADGNTEGTNREMERDTDGTVQLWTSLCHVVVCVLGFFLSLKVLLVHQSFYAALDHLDVGCEPRLHLRYRLKCVCVCVWVDTAINR